jgi:predicted TIM-barrel fold metal-dependent hydrolase
MDGVRELERRVRDDGFKMARIMAFHTLIPYNDPRCYPLYAKCVELDVPISINVGVPGPLVPAAKLQDPLVLDEICSFFPELKIIMAHGGDPWAELCVKLMLKWKNLYYMTSAFSPKRLPAAIVHYLNTRGSDKVMWASDYPLLGFDRCAQEIANLDLRSEDIRRRFGRDNARRILFGEEGA